MFDFGAAAGAAPFGWARCGLPAGFAALHEAQRRNVQALVAASRMAMTGYQDVYAHMVERCAAAMAEQRDRLEAMQGRPMDAENAARAIADTRAAFERGMADLRSLTEMARTTSADAFAILRARTEEALAEMRRAGERHA